MNEDDAAGGEGEGENPDLAITFTAIAERSWRRPEVGMVLVYVIAVSVVLTVRGAFTLWGIFLSPIWLLALPRRGGGEVVVDAEGVRGAPDGDRMTWRFIDRVEMADASWRSQETQVIGRYGNSAVITPEMRIEGSADHPADLLRRAALARGIDVLGSSPVQGHGYRRLAVTVLVLVSLLAFAVLLPLPNG